jgi:predicted RNA-binding protein with PIN domain
MSGRILIIDGYNLLHAAGWAQSRYAAGELEACRTRLLKFLAERLSSDEAVRTTVVFDARHPPVAAPRFLSHGLLRVLFASPHGDADRMIEELLENSASPRTITLISSDRRLQVAARNEKATSISSQDFLESLRSRKSAVAEQQRELAEKPDRVTNASELDFWLRVFGNVATTIPDEPPPHRPTATSKHASGSTTQAAARSSSGAPAAKQAAAKQPSTKPNVASSATSKSTVPNQQLAARAPQANQAGTPSRTTKSKAAKAKSVKPQSQNTKAVKTLSTDVTEWLTWAAEVQAWLDDLQRHGGDY